MPNPVGATTYRRVIGDDSFASDEPIDRQRPPELERPLPGRVRSTWARSRLLADRPELTLLELAHRQAAPSVGRSNDSRVHELQHGTFAEGVRDDLGATSLFEEEPLEPRAPRATTVAPSAAAAFAPDRQLLDARDEPQVATAAAAHQEKEIGRGWKTPWTTGSRSR
jgi:hypothetical protein